MSAKAERENRKGTATVAGLLAWVAVAALGANLSADLAAPALDGLAGIDPGLSGQICLGVAAIAFAAFARR